MTDVSLEIDRLYAHTKTLVHSWNGWPPSPPTRAIALLAQRASLYERDNLICYLAMFSLCAARGDTWPPSTPQLAADHLHEIPDIREALGAALKAFNENIAH